jgi:hypothetical protein
MARKLVAALIAGGKCKAPRASKPNSQAKLPKKRGGRNAVPVRKEAN